MSLLHALAPLFDPDAFDVTVPVLMKKQRVPATQQRVVPSYDKRELSRFGATDVTENDDSLVFEVDAPGCTSNDFNIEVSKQWCMRSMMMSSPNPRTPSSRVRTV